MTCRRVDSSRRWIRVCRRKAALGDRDPRGYGQLHPMHALLGKMYEAHAAQLAVDTIVQIRGTITEQDNEYSLRVSNLRVLLIQKEMTGR